MVLNLTIPQELTLYKSQDPRLDDQTNWPLPAYPSLPSAQQLLQPDPGPQINSIVHPTA